MQTASLNNSATGGYLTQTTGPLEGSVLLRFIHGVIAGVTALPGNLVRPAFQINPPPLPSHEVNWCAFLIDVRKLDYSASESGFKGEKYTIKHHEQLDVSCSFYGPDCVDYAGRLVAGMELAQNHEELLKAGMGFKEFTDVKHVSELFNERFYDRADVTMSIRRECVRTYGVLTMQGIKATIIGDDAHDMPLKKEIEVKKGV